MESAHCRQVRQVAPKDRLSDARHSEWSAQSYVTYVFTSGGLNRLQSSYPNGEPYHSRQLSALHTIASGEKLPTAIEGIGALKHNASRWGRSVVLQATNGGTTRVCSARQRICHHTLVRLSCSISIRPSHGQKLFEIVDLPTGSSTHRSARAIS